MKKHENWIKRHEKRIPAKKFNGTFRRTQEHDILCWLGPDDVSSGLMRVPAQKLNRKMSANTRIVFPGPNQKKLLYIQPSAATTAVTLAFGSTTQSPLAKSKLSSLKVYVHQHIQPAWPVPCSRLLTCFSVIVSRCSQFVFPAQ